MRTVKYLLFFLLLLTGCSNTAWQLSSGTPHTNAQVQVSTGTGFAALLGVTILAAGVYEAARSGFPFAGESARAPEMAPDRKVSEQDCSKPLDYSLGNIRCK